MLHSVAHVHFSHFMCSDDGNWWKKPQPLPFDEPNSHSHRDNSPSDSGKSRDNSLYHSGKSRDNSLYDSGKSRDNSPLNSGRLVL